MATKPAKKQKFQLTMVNGKIGKIDLTESEREILAEGADSAFWKVLRDKVMPQQLVKLSLELLNGPPTEDRMNEYRGRSNEWDRMVKFVDSHAKSYHTDPDGSSTDTVEQGDGLEG